MSAELTDLLANSRTENLGYFSLCMAFQTGGDSLCSQVSFTCGCKIPQWFQI